MHGTSVVALGALQTVSHGFERDSSEQLGCGEHTGSHDMLVFYVMKMAQVSNRVSRHFRHRDMVQAAVSTTAKT